jgi:oxygen-independent coproporphyrinogen-3 oxidase
MTTREFLSENSDHGGIYIHIPFCRRKCHYCDFYSISDLSQQHRFIEALLEEMELAASSSYCLGLEFDSLYMGGGTPSVLTRDAIVRVVTSAYRHFRIALDSEVTIEVNPGTVSMDDLRYYHDIGINRINIGIQSFQENNLAFLGRIHSAVVAEKTLAEARKIGFNNIGIDLIYGLPEQSEKDWSQDLERAVAYHPEHLSCYTLTYDKGTAITADMQRGKFVPAKPEQVAQLYLFTVGALRHHGYEQYETSNFARSISFRSRHNYKYWNFTPYLGLGPSAHSFFLPERVWNKSDLKSYLVDLENGCRPVGGQETLTREQLMIETVYLGLRLSDGIDLAKFERCFSEKFQVLFKKPLAVSLQDGLLEITEGRCRLKPRGMLLIDSIASSLIDHI